MASFMETKHHKTQTRGDAHKHWGDTLNHTHSHSQGCVILWCYFSQKAFPQAHQSLCIWIQNTGLKYENHVHHCDTLLSFKPTTGGLYSCLLFCSLLCCRCRCHRNRWVFSVCLKLNVWPTHVFPNKQDTWKYSKRMCRWGNEASGFAYTKYLLYSHLV